MKIKLPELKNVMEVYSGREGCMCGCRGKYSVAKAYKKLCDKKRGYALNNASDRSVKIIYNKIKKMCEDPNITINHGKSGTQGHIAIDREGRTLAIYYIS